MNEQQDRLFKLADLVMALGIKRGHNYELQVWHSMFTHWCEQNNISPEQVSMDSVQELKKRSIIFCDYFV